MLHMGKITRSKEKNLDIKCRYMIELTAIADAISKTLMDNFLGFYIMGSFVMGDWNPKKSDIDFIVVTRKPLNKEESIHISKLHHALSKSEVGKRLDGAYTYLQQLQEKRFEEKTGSVENHEFIADSPCHLSADNVLCLLQYGECILGKPIKELSLSVSDEELVQAARDMLTEDADEIDKKQDFQTLYDILIDMLRCIYTLETKKLPTKPRAIEHCRRLLDRALYENIKALQNGNVKEFAIDKTKLKLIAAYGMSLRERHARVYIH
jgi:streptomycin 3"-adenylyltransferase